MKANEAPEKIYIQPNIGGRELIKTWFPVKIDQESIEYVRKDAFTEKVCEWLSLNMKMLMNVLDVEYDTHDIDIKVFIDDFRRHIKD